MRTMICTKYRCTLGNKEKSETAAGKSLDIQGFRALQSLITGRYCLCLAPCPVVEQK